MEETSGGCLEAVNAIGKILEAFDASARKEILKRAMVSFVRDEKYFVESNDYNLQDFCVSGDMQWYMSSPWTDGERTYATNGSCIVEIDREIEKWPRMHEVEDKGYRVPPCRSLLEDDLKIISGWSSFRLNECDCGKSPCECVLKFGDSKFARKLVVLYTRFAGLMIGYKETGSNDHVLAFRFRGGRGMIMPLRD